jgi:hypothetical protein
MPDQSGGQAPHLVLKVSADLDHGISFGGGIQAWTYAFRISLGEVLARVSNLPDFLPVIWHRLARGHCAGFGKLPTKSQLPNQI